MLTHDTEVVSRGLSRLLAQFRGKPRIEALLTSWLDEFQELEDALYEVYFNRELQQRVATGDLLIKLGNLVGQQSEGLSDPDFLILITARIKANRSTGRRQDLIDIGLVLSPDGVVVIKDLPPASVYVQIEDLAFSPVLVVKDFLGRAVAAGVRLIFVWSSAPASNTLTFGSINGFSPTADQSPGSINAVGIGGGQFAGALQVTGGLT